MSMASLHLLPHSLLSRSRYSSPIPHEFLPHFNARLNKLLISVKASANEAATNESSEAPAPTRRRKKQPSPSSTATKTTRPKKTKAKTKTKGAAVDSDEDRLPEPDDDNEYLTYDDGMDFPYDDPPLICCFGAAQKEFVPSVRVHDNQMHQDMYSQWKMLQWDPPEFARAPGGAVSNVAIAHVRLGGRAAFMGKVGKDAFGDELVLKMNTEMVQTRAVKFDPDLKTNRTYMKIKFDDGGKMKMEVVKEAAEDSLLSSELSLAVLKEARIFHFNSETLTTKSMYPTLFKAIKISKHFGGLIFFDPNLPLPLWKSRDGTRKILNQAWQQSDIIEVSRQELEFLLDEHHYENKRNYRPQYYAEQFEQTKNRRDYYHYTPEEIAPLWHDNLKLLFVTDGTLRIHYYARGFDGVAVGTEDVLITPFTCDRTGSGDAVVAGILRKVTINPEMFNDKDTLERELRFAIAAGIIAQWTIGGVRGFPTESATQNLREQVYVPSMW